jgi:UrcA family protein
MEIEMTRLIAVASLVLTVASASAHAGESVKFDRSQLNDPEYAAAIHDKIEAAARKECRDLYGSSIMANYLIRACIEDTVKETVYAVNDPFLTAYYAGEEPLAVVASAKE